jgi:hypothetical protein
MTGKYLFFFTLISCFTVSVFAQKQNVYFLKNDGKEVGTRDSADFIRIISELYLISKSITPMERSNLLVKHQWGIKDSF